MVGNYPRCQFWEIGLQWPQRVGTFQIESKSNLKRLQQKETIKRYQFINDILKESVLWTMPMPKTLGVVSTGYWPTKFGAMSFFCHLTPYFQAILIGEATQWILSMPLLRRSAIGASMRYRLGTWPIWWRKASSRIGGIVIFIPQIAFSFYLFRCSKNPGIWVGGIFNGSHHASIWIEW